MNMAVNSCAFLARRDSRRQEVQRLLGEAALFRLVALGFGAPKAVRLESVRKSLNDALAAEDLVHREPSIVRALRGARLAWFTATPSGLSAEYLHLFMGAAVVSLHETAYGDGRRIGGRAFELADIGGFYASFGFTMHELDPVLPDHLCAECEFMSLLSIKEAYALTNGWTAQCVTTRVAANKFLEQHLGRWTSGLSSSLRHEKGPYAFSALLHLLEMLIWVRRRARGIRYMPTNLADSTSDSFEEGLVCLKAGEES
jgi:TorA maturation chaperone TorD